jgi:hypothetical protein
MAGRVGVDLLLFVAGEPDSGVGSTQDVQTSIAGRLVGSFLGGWVSGSSGAKSPTSAPQGALPDGQPWHLPPQQVQATDIVLDAARGKGRTVTIVDVNRPAGNQALVDRWVGQDGVLPLLVRSDGGRLEGIEKFVPRKVRDFIDRDHRGVRL